MTSVPRVRPKEFHFPLAVRAAHGRTVTVEIEGKQPLDVAPPPVFRGVDPDVWSPEDLFVGAAASCLAVTFTGLAERAGLAYESLSVAADGVAGNRDDGAFGFTRVLLELRVVAAPDDVPLARELGERAEATCLVSASLALPVEVAVTAESVLAPIQ